MDQPTFTKLTGRTLTTAQAALLAGSAETAKRTLEDLLGWPLDPDCWEDQYLERGKTQSDYVCIDDATELDAPDDVVGSTRIFNWNPNDYYLQTDPLVMIHSVKLVSDDLTYKTFELGEYRPQWINGRERYTKYIEIRHDCWWYMYHLGCCCGVVGRQIAVDADWAFEKVPQALKLVLADLIWEDLNPRRDLRSQTLGPHSYTFATSASALTKHAATIRQYAGPRGTASGGMVIV